MSTMDQNTKKKKITFIYLYLNQTCIFLQVTYDTIICLNILIEGGMGKSNPFIIHYYGLTLEVGFKLLNV